MKQSSSRTTRRIKDSSSKPQSIARIVPSSQPIAMLKGVGIETEKLLHRLKLKTVADLVDHWPRCYDDYSQVQTLRAIRPGMVVVRATIKQVAGRYGRTGMHITEAVASDATGSVRLTWFNQPYRAQSIKADQEYFILGEYGLSYQHLQIINPSIELASDFPVNTARIVPIYRETKGLRSALLRKLLYQTLPFIASQTETLPDWIVKDRKLLPYNEALKQLHFPETTSSLEKAQSRFGFEEVFRLSLASLLNKQEFQKETALSIPFDESLAKDFVTKLPFRLTNAQRKTIWQIYLDMQKTLPMNRLVEGDVGSGKTVVAAMAAIMALAAGYQVALMAPTEILARQHAESLYEMLSSTPFQSVFSLLVGGLKPSQKAAVHDQLAKGTIKFIVGTQALIQDTVSLDSLGLIIIDEQHRFGVEQRKALQAKAGHMPHVLSLTATPIPRSLALTLYGELDISILDELPPGRQPIKTKVCEFGAHSAVDEHVVQQLAAGRQVFVVCPTIVDNSDDELQPIGAARSAEKVFKELQAAPAYKRYKIALLHGKQTPAEKEQTMQLFAQHKIDVLVSTTIIEVGVNIPNASVMVVESAERFGLAQLHQLRGRVGRGKHQSYCFYITSPEQRLSKRLRALEQTTDGFKLAELDLNLRGPGAIYGTMQHGALDLRIAKLSDSRSIAAARATAQKFIDCGEDLLEYPELNAAITRLRKVTNLN